MAIITTQKKSIFRKRRDKQIPTAAGSVVSGGGGGVSNPLDLSGFATLNDLAAYYTAAELDAGQLDNRYYTETEADALFVALTGDQTISGVKTFSDGIKSDSIQSETAFSSGFAGSGFKLSEESGISRLELDEMIIRGSLQAYELMINKIRASNGSIWVSDAVKAVTNWNWDSTLHRWYFEASESSMNTFAAGDIIKAQQWTGSSILSYVLTVHSVSGAKVYVNEEASAVDRSDGLSPTGYHSMSDIDCTTFTAAVDGYTIEGGIGEKFKTSSFSLTGLGKVAIEIYSGYASNGSAFTVNLKRASDDAVIDTASGNWVSGDSDSVWLYVDDETYIGTTAYLEFVFDAYDDLYEVELITLNDLTGIPTTDDVEGLDFVRIGNSTTSSRQGSLYLTASDSNAPYMDVIDGVDESTIAASNIKARFGNLTGITYNGSALSGYGLYAENAYLTGNFVSSSAAGQKVEIDADNNRILLWTADTSAHPRVYIDDNVYDGKVGILLDGPDSELGWFTTGRMGINGGDYGGGSFDVDANASSSNIIIRVTGLPTSLSGLTSGTLYNDSGTLKIA